MASLQYINPFVGLRAFEESEDYLFFGRGKEIDDLVKKFSENRFLAVIGTSGSGKSSLVKSGMLPQIYGGFMKAGGNWRVALMQPGENPIGYLATQLAKEGVLYSDTGDADMPYEAVIESRLRRSEHGLQHVYTDAHLPEGENLLIVVDQFEELFRFNKYEKENNLGQSDAMHFVQILLTASAELQYPIYVLLTMRSDFLGDCSEFRGLPEAINLGQYLVPRMTRDEIREAITGPVAVSNATISGRLVTRLLNDINDDTDQLPVLQHAMMRTWDAWHKRAQPDTPIDFEDYDKIGTMESALSQHADEAYAELGSAHEQRICETMFKALTDTSTDKRGIRRPKTITDLCILTGATQKEIKKQVEIFRKPGRTFLMPPRGVELKDETIIDISHESLMRIWARLVEWTDEEARSGAVYQRLANSAQLWESGQRGLLKDPELSIAIRWRENNKPTLKWAEGYKADFEKTMSYLDESQVKDLEEKKILAEREAKGKRMEKLIRRQLIFWLVTVLISAVAIALILNRQRDKAVSEAKEAKNDAHAQKELFLKTDSALRDLQARPPKVIVPPTDPAVRDSLINEREIAQFKAQICESERESQKKELKTKKQNIDSLRRLINLANAKRDHYRMYQSHIDSILRFSRDSHDSVNLWYHLKLLGRHMDGFDKKLGLNYPRTSGP